MLTFVQFLEELSRHQTVAIPGIDVERLAKRFPQVRSIGFWNKTGDGSIDVPIGNITEAIDQIGNRVLTEAVGQLKTPEQFAGVLNSSTAAGQLIEALSNLYLQQFQRRVETYQNSGDATEVERLRHEISRELFGA